MSAASKSKCSCGAPLVDRYAPTAVPDGSPFCWDCRQEFSKYAVQVRRAFWKLVNDAGGPVYGLVLDSDLRRKVQAGRWPSRAYTAVTESLAHDGELVAVEAQEGSAWRVGPAGLAGIPASKPERNRG